MSGMLTDGIKRQFPNIFRGCGSEKSNQKADITSGIRLHQNAPNPFANKTNISYFIPDNAMQAQLIVYDVTGNAIKKFDIRTKGEGNLIFDASHLKKRCVYVQHFCRWKVDQYKNNDSLKTAGMYRLLRTRHGKR